MKDNEYRCAVCGMVYEKGQTDEEAEEELHNTFGADVEPEDCDIVCDDCYIKLFGSESEEEKP
jgi:rubredoxin